MKHSQSKKPKKSYATLYTTQKSNTVLPWALAALFAGAGIAYFATKKHDCANKANMPQTNVIYNNHIRTSVTENKNYQKKEASPNISTNQRKNAQEHSTKKTSLQEQVVSSSLHNSLTPAVDSIDKTITSSKNVPGALNDATTDPALIKEWQGVKNYYTTKVKPNFVDHHYKTRSMKIKKPCNNK